jgi:hydroxyethylthiazole kinase
MNQFEYVESIWSDLLKVKETRPLVHNITNYVAMNFTANALLALGASPIMAHAHEELNEIAAISDSLVLNFGTLDEYWLESMRIALEAAKKLGKPVVLDPVGAGATSLRTNAICNMLHSGGVSVLRGNASEIMALHVLCFEQSRNASTSKGVDSLHTSAMAIEAAYELAKSLSIVVIVSGSTDYITTGKDLYSVQNGSPLMTRITTMGCAASALVAAFAAVNPDYSRASAHAMSCMGIAGEVACSGGTGPGAAAFRFLDELHFLDQKTIEERLSIEYRNER